MTGIDIKPVRYGAPVAQRLIADLLADLAARYGEADATLTNAVEFDPPDGGFFVAYVDGVPAGCGGWRSWQQSDQVAEIKRVYTVEAVRGRGAARAIMAQLEADAKAHGRRRVILETGSGQPEALAFYETIGYQRIPDFGHYRDHPGVRSYGRDI